MAGSFSDFTENELLDHLFSAATYTPPVTLYFSLYTVTPTDAGGGTEVTGGAYARVAVTNNATNFPAAAGGAKSNGTVITYPTASANWGTVVAMGIHDAATAGNLLGWSDLTVSQVINSGSTPSFPVGDVDLALA